MTVFFDKLEVSMVNKLNEAEKDAKKDIYKKEKEMTN